MSHSHKKNPFRSRKKNPSHSSNRHPEKNPPSSDKPHFSEKSWDADLDAEHDPHLDDNLDDAPTAEETDAEPQEDEDIDEEPTFPDRPVWLPQEEKLKWMSATVRRAVFEIIQPVYEELVDQAHSAIEKSLGLSLVHCLWLEILNQQGIKSMPAGLECLYNDNGRHKTIDQFFKLTNAKIRISNILTRLQELRLKQQLSNDRAKNVQNPKFDDENRMPDSPAQDQKVQKQESAHENPIPDFSNQDLRPKAQDQNVQKQESAHENHLPFSLPPYTYPFQQTSNMQNQKFDDKKSTATNPNLDSHISNLKFQIPQQSDAQNQPSLPLPPSASPIQKDPNVQNCKFDDEKQMPDSPNQDRKPKAQDSIVQNPKIDDEIAPRSLEKQDAHMI